MKTITLIATGFIYTFSALGAENTPPKETRWSRDVTCEGYLSYMNEDGTYFSGKSFSEKLKFEEEQSSSWYFGRKGNTHVMRPLTEYNAKQIIDLGPYKLNINLNFFPDGLNTVGLPSYFKPGLNALFKVTKRHKLANGESLDLLENFGGTVDSIEDDLSKKKLTVKYIGFNVNDLNNFTLSQFGAKRDVKPEEFVSIEVECSMESVSVVAQIQQ